MRYQCKKCDSEASAVRQKVRYLTDPDAVKLAWRLRRARWVTNNPDKARDNDLKSKLRQLAKDPDNVAAVSTSRKKGLKKAPWTTWPELWKVYREARAISRATGVPHEVDHIIPRRHPAVCGLHCLENLRIIKSTHNQAKSNRLPAELKDLFWDSGYPFYTLPD